MDLTFNTKEKENSQVLLTITVNKDEIRNHYDKLLKDAQKQAEIKGFRKGKVPISILETKFKKGFLAETANHVIEEAFKEVIDKVDPKPLPIAQPKLENFVEPQLDTDYTFELTYDIYPKFEVSDLSEIEVEKDNIKIKKKDVDNEINKYIKDFSTIEPKDDVIGDNDIVSINYTVLNEEKEVYKKENEHIYIGKDIDPYKLGNDLIGMKKGDEKEFEKSFGEDETEELKNKTFKINLKINEVKEEKKPELNDELVKEIDENINSVDEFKSKIKENLNKFAENTMKNKVIDEVLNQLVETFKGDIPESMMNQQIDMYYNDFVSKLGGDEKKALNILKMENLTKETYKDKMKDNALIDIKKGLIVKDISTKSNIEISDEDIDKFVEPMAQQYKMEKEKLIKMFKDMGRYDMLKGEIETNKTYDYIYENVKTKKGKDLTIDDLNKPNK